MRRLARSLLVLSCLLAAASPAFAGGDAGDGAGEMADLRREANEAAGRYSQAQAEYERLTGDVADLERQVAEMEHRLAPLRQVATRGAAALYKRDAVVAAAGWMEEGDGLLQPAREAKLLSGINGVTTAAIRSLEASAREVAARKRTLDDRRGDQEQVLAQLAGERREVERRLNAMVKAEREKQARLVAAQRAAARADRAARARAARAARATRAVVVAPPPPPRPVPAVPSSFICPIRGPVAYSDDFGAPRGGRRHQGNDLMNPRGTDNVAVVAGNVEFRHWGGGGLTIFLTGDDGNTYVYMHLLDVVGPPRHVEQGDVIGHTGASGNATAYHTHFEFHPGGGPPANPYPLIAAHC
jgi:murein DD-endopeptidase MepM/ murein hydrolase activator NlpD